MSVDFATQLPEGTTWELTAEVASLVPFDSMRRLLEGRNIGKFKILQVEKTETIVRRFWLDANVVKIRFFVLENPLPLAALVAGILIVLGVTAGAFLVRELRMLVAGGGSIPLIAVVAGVVASLYLLRGGKLHGAT